MKPHLVHVENDGNKAVVAGDRTEKEHLSRRIRTLESQNQELQEKLSSSEVARTTAQAQEGVTAANLALARSKQKMTDEALTSMTTRFATQEIATTKTLNDNERLRDDLSWIQEERRRDQEVHTKEKEDWVVEKAQLRAELAAMRATENAKVSVTPALLDALIGVDSLARLAVQ